MTHQEDYQTTLPLRTIYTLNSQTQQRPQDFKTMLMEHLAELPAQPCTLPPVFLATFIQKCFPTDIDSADFDQALTALDYIRDLESRRKKELAKAIRFRGESDEKVIRLRARSSKLDLQYAKALVGLRRWTLIHELRNPNFNRSNCIALLNTLYPIDETKINDLLTADTLATQRSGLWKYIVAVHKNGSKVLDSVLDANGGWESVAEAANKYCSDALDLIKMAEDISRPTSYGSFQSDSSVEDLPTRHGLRRTDSSAEVSVWETETTGKRSKLDKLVRGLQKLGHKKSFYNTSEWSSNEDVKMRS